MALKVFKPTSAGVRGLVLVDRSQLWNGSPYKALTQGLIGTGGRNNTGRITTRQIGGGHKRRYRFVDFKRIKDDVPAVVERLEYDPNRTAFIALIKYADGEYSYILAPQRLNIGDTLMSGDKADITPGSAMELRKIPVGTIVHNVELRVGRGGQMARSAGSYAQIIGRDSEYVLLRLSSGELRRFNGRCRATIGAVSNPDQKNINLGKAGRSRWRGIRPTVRGIAMNPVDHPHGGRTNGGRHPCSYSGVPAKGKKTRVKKPSDKFIITRRKK
jgi:large subunit ribosomal protein L2